jgi:hypothetical protein
VDHGRTSSDDGENDQEDFHISLPCSFNTFQGHLFEVVDELFHSTLSLRIYHQGFQTILLTPDPPHDSTSNKEA